MTTEKIDEWCSTVDQQLTLNQSRYNSFQELIIQSTHLLLSEKQLSLDTKYLRDENSRLKHENQALASNQVYANVPGTEDMIKIQDDYKESLKKIIGLKEKLEEKHGLILQLENEKGVIQELVEDLEGRTVEVEEKIVKKDTYMTILKDELKKLQIELIKSEDRSNDLEKENEILTERWMQKTQEEVDRMNEMYRLMNELQIAKEEAKKRRSELPVEDDNYGISTSSNSIPKTVKRHIKVNNEVNALGFSSNGSMIAVGGTDRVLRLYDTTTGSLRAGLNGAERTIMSVDFSNNDELVLGSSNDNAVRVWSITMQRIRHSLLGHTQKVYAAQFTFDSQKVVTGSHDRTVRIWDLNRGFCLKTIFCYSSCNDVSLSRDSGVAISGHVDNRLRFWDIKSGDCVQELGGLHDGQITSVEISNDGWTILTNSRDNTLKTIDMRTYDTLQTFSNREYKNGLNWTRACFSPDGGHVACGSSNGTVFIWRQNGQIETQLKNVHDQVVTSCVWSPHMLASCDKAGGVVLWQ